MRPLAAEKLFPLSLAPKLVPIARKISWWGNPEEWVADQRRFLAQVMTYGDWDSVQSTLALVGEEAFRRVLNDSPPGVFDIRSWNYWHLVLKVRPVGPLPGRKL